MTDVGLTGSAGLAGMFSAWDEMTWAEMTWAEMAWAEMTWAEMTWAEMTWACKISVNLFVS